VLETVPPGISATVPFENVKTGATDARCDAGHAASVTSVDALNPTSPTP
jgi:hypothetical protein